MTNLEKIKTKVKHPMLEDADFISALEDRGMVNTDVFTDSNIRSIELTRADLLMIMLGFPDVKEGGFSTTQKTVWSDVASGIYEKYGDSASSGPTVTFVQPW